MGGSGRVHLGGAALCLALLAAPAGAGRAAQEGQAGDKLVYADFETLQENRPVSSRGGLVQLVSYQERATNQSRYKGLANANPPAPEPVRLKQGDPNRAVAFDYELPAPNQYAGVGVEVHGRPDEGGKTVPDDVSGYKYVTLQAYATGVSSLRLELISRGQGLSTNGYPQMTFKVTPGFNTYRVPLKSLAQPGWAQPRVSPKEVLKKLTAVSVTAYCDNCVPTKGTVVIDNIVFEN